MLTDEQKAALREFLEHRGLSFKPLQDEMVDHMGCDLEDRMATGLSFEEAWDESIREIPANHFQRIQQEVMESINKRVTWSQGLSFLALGLIFISVLFKKLHLQFAGEALLLSFGFMGGALLTGSLSGIRLGKGRKGAIRLLVIISGVILLLVGFGFKLLHLPEADQFIVLAVAVLIISLLINSIYVFQHASGEENLLTYLHEKYTPGIERFFLFLLLPLVVYKGALILMGTNDFLGNIMLLIVIFGAGLQFIALAWRTMEKDLDKRRPLMLMATIASCLCLVLPFLGMLLPQPLRIVLVAFFSPIAGGLAYAMEEAPRKWIHAVPVALVIVVFMGWALIKLNVIPSASSWMFFNIPMLVLLVAGLFVSKKHGAVRAFMLVSVAGYLLEYMS